LFGFLCRAEVLQVGGSGFTLADAFACGEAIQPLGLVNGSGLVSRGVYTMRSADYFDEQYY